MKVFRNVTFSGAMQFVQTLAVVLATGYMALQLGEMRDIQQASVQAERVRTSLELIRRWNDPQMAEVSHKAVDLLRSGQSIAGHPVAHDVHVFLNFYEEMALSVENSLADERICRQFFQGPVLTAYDGAKAVIEVGTGYPNLRSLKKKWAHK